MPPFALQPFVPPPWLRNPHAQTLWSARLKPAPRVAYRRERWETGDGDFVVLDFIAGAAAAPTVLLLHGLEGSSQSRYARRLMALLRRRGWNGVVLHHRGCGGKPNRLLPAYHSGKTDDLALVVRRLVARAAVGREVEVGHGAAVTGPTKTVATTRPGRAAQIPTKSRAVPPLFIVGYSLGGNVLAKWLGESHREVPAAVRGACVVSAPHDLAATQPVMDRGLSRLIYVSAFLRSLKAKTRAKAHRFPGAIDLPQVLHARTLAEFDDAATAPLFGFADAADYYVRASALPFLRRVRVPTLLLNARDDPLVPAHALPTSAQVSAAVRPHQTDHGGHLGFVHRDDAWWLERQIGRWFAGLLR